MNLRPETITIYRNMGYRLPILLQSPVVLPPASLTAPFPGSGPIQTAPQDISGYALALKIFVVPGGYNTPTDPNIFTPPVVPSFNPEQAGVLDTPILINTTPFVQEPGLATFQLSPTDTASLNVGTQYKYIVTYAASGQNPTLAKWGRVRVIDV